MPVTLVRKASSTPDLIVQAALRMEPKIQAAFINAVEAYKSDLDLQKIAQLIAKGDSNAILAYLAVDKKFVSALDGIGLESSIESFRDAIGATVAAGAAAGAKILPAKIAVEISFDLKNPEAVKFIDSYAFNLIRQVSDETKQAIRNVVADAFEHGGHPYEQARTIREFIGLTENQMKAVMNYRDALEQGRLTETLERALRDGRFDRTILSAVQNDKALSQAQIDKMVTRYQERFVQHRAQTIARTESIRASNKGQRELWRQAREQGLLDDDVKRVWIVSGDERTCDECDEMDGETAELDEEFSPGIDEPPLHPDCRCSLALEFPKAGDSADEETPDEEAGDDEG